MIEHGFYQVDSPISKCERAPSIIELYIKLIAYLFLILLMLLFIVYIFKLVWQDISTRIED